MSWVRALNLRGLMLSPGRWRQKWATLWDTPLVLQRSVWRGANTPHLVTKSEVSCVRSEGDSREKGELGSPCTGGSDWVFLTQPAPNARAPLT